jgi:uracil-DNA glycosylase
MEWNKFAPLFHESWHNKIRKFVESSECDKIYAYLKKESQRGKSITPDSRHTFRAFLETSLDEVKVVILGFCPYHSFINNVPVADGLAFSCSISNKLQPSLEKFYEGIECDLNNCLNLNYKKNPDLSFLAKQGVLLLNSALTVEKLKAGSHQAIWHPFTKYIIEECLAYTGIPIILIGKDAQVFEKYMTPLTHGYIFKIEHPSFAARENREWETEGVFKNVSKIVKMSNGYDIDWLNEEKNNQDEPPF